MYLLHAAELFIIDDMCHETLMTLSALKTPQAFAEQMRHLERAKVSVNSLPTRPLNSGPINYGPVNFGPSTLSLVTFNSGPVNYAWMQACKLSFLEDHSYKMMNYLPYLF